MCEESISSHSPLSQISCFSVAHASSVGSLDSEIECPPTTKTDMPDVPLISMLDRYMSDELQPWSQYHLSHQLGDHDIVLAKHRQIFAQVTELVDLSDEQNSSPGPCCIDDQFFLDSYSAMYNEQEDENSEAAALEDLFGLAVTLAKYQNKHGEFAPPTLKQEFELAKAAERNNNHEEAEYHCRRILDRHPQIDVQSFLGLILANASRLEESTFLLFSALTVFIIQFPLSSIEGNALVFAPIESLFSELFLRSDQDWTSLSSCMCQMMTTIQRAISEGNIDQIFPELFINGFSFAHECSVLEIIDSAKHMYQFLFEHSPFPLDDILHGIEKATAHQKYGLLLRREERWISSAEQLLLACESAMNSGTHDSRLIALLESDYVDLLPHLAPEPNEEDSLPERIRKMLARNQRQNSPRIQDTSETVQVSRIEEYFLSDLPIHFATFEPSAASYFAHVGVPSRATKLAHGDGDRTSTASASASASVSRKYGMTYSVSEVTGISDSIFMVP